MRKIYTAPDAQVILLAPCEGIAAVSQWNSDNSSWKTNGLFWKQNETIPDSPASGTTYWYDFGSDELN